ncbi:MAG: S8 family serine peptidase [Pseudonocardiaceae bacterium]
MPRVTYGGKDGETIQLEVDPDLLAVRTRSRRPLMAGPVPGPEAALISGLDVVLAVPEAGVEVYRRRDAAASVAELQEALSAAPDTRFAGRVLIDEQTGEPVLYTENIFVKFRDALSADQCRQVLRDAGLTIKDEPGYATNAYFTAAPEGTGQEVFAIAQRLLERPDVELAHPELVRKLGRRALPAQQWHLASTTVNGTVIEASANVAAAHAVTRGEGITIAIIDTGIDIDHEEFASPRKIVAPRDASAGDDDPRPLFGENHGTACAGVACADGQVGACGVAPRAALMPIRMTSTLGSRAEADAFFWAANHGADVISCSWGPSDGMWSEPADPGHRARFRLPDQTRLAIEHAVTQGRGGKGCLVFFAAGNGNESIDLDGYASNPSVLAVAACNDRGKRSVYSDFGDAVFCAFPSNDFAFSPEGRPAPLTPGIWTTDISGRGGYNPNPRTGAVSGDPKGNYTNSFGGTSSACPGAAGVAALVLSCNPELSRQDVVDILRRSCDRIDEPGGRWSAAGHSPLYGHGRLNAATAVRLAAITPADRLRLARTARVTAAAEPVWRVTNAPVASSRTDDIWFRDPLRGWAVNSNGQILHTEDGFVTWTEQFHDPEVYLRCVGFASDTRGWVGTLSETKRLFETSDGGTTWTAVENLPPLAPSAVCGMSVVDSSVVYASGTNFPNVPPRMMRTIDGGASWQAWDMSAHASLLVDCFFDDVERGFVAGGKSQAANPTRANVRAVVLRTEDGGQTWVNTLAGLEEQLPLGEWGWKIQFLDERVGFVALESFTRGAILKTVDGGASWTRLEINDPQGNANLEGVGFVDENTGWVGGWGSASFEEGFSSATTDGGQNWRNANEIGAFINRFRFFHDPVTVGYASGLTVYRYAAEPLPVPRHAAPLPHLRLLADNAPRRAAAPLPITVTVPRGAVAMTINIWDRFGAHVRRLLAESPPPAGSRTLEWDGTDEAGHALAAGSFLLRVSVDGHSESQIVYLTR